MGKWLFVGLGNIGEKYVHTRHNIGFDIVDCFAEEKQLVWEASRLAYTISCRLANEFLCFIKPATYMNESGKAVKYYMDKNKIPIANVLVFVDDINLPLATLRLRLSGGAGGHNGLKSIEAYLGATAYARLRFGIGNNYPKGAQTDFVLGKWKVHEQTVIAEKIRICADMIPLFVRHKETAIRQLNGI